MDRLSWLLSAEVKLIFQRVSMYLWVKAIGLGSEEGVILVTALTWHLTHFFRLAREIPVRSAFSIMAS
jgi:hypothetical protein